MFNNNDNNDNQSKPFFGMNQQSVHSPSSDPSKSSMVFGMSHSSAYRSQNSITQQQNLALDLSNSSMASFMLHSSSYPSEQNSIMQLQNLALDPPKLGFGSPIIYSNRSDNIDVCVPCYTKMSTMLKSKLLLSEGYKYQTENLYYWCDICRANIFVGMGSLTKLQILLKLKDSGLDIDNLVASCALNPWNGGMELLFSELIYGGMDRFIAKEVVIKLNGGVDPLSQFKKFG